MPPEPDILSDAFLEAIIEAVLEAGRSVMEVYAGDFSVAAKGDASPVTEADRRAEAILAARLAALAPAIPVVAEEACSEGCIPAVGARFFLVDPVDGTREFVSRNGDFTVNVGLVEEGVPTLGVVHAPAHRLLYAGRAGRGAERLDIAEAAAPIRRRIAVADPPPAPPRIVASRSHRTPETDAFIGRYPGASIVAAGSSLKFCRLAEGEADLYPRLGPTMQWDTAAGDAVLRAAGGMVTTVDGRPLRYGPGAGPGAAAFSNPWFVASGAVRMRI